MPFNTNLRKILNRSATVRVLGTTLIALVISILLLQSRSLHRKEKTPAFFVPTAEEHCWIEIQNRAGKRQIYDVLVADCVDQMTLWVGASPSQARYLGSINYVSGQHIEIVSKDDGNEELEFGWMRAGKRMALGILLHPDRMDVIDWQDLRGIGPALAHRIINDRQKNGDFGCVVNLKRISGIGDKTLSVVHPWFMHPTRSYD